MIRKSFSKVPNSEYFYSVREHFIDNPVILMKDNFADIVVVHLGNHPANPWILF